MKNSELGVLVRNARTAQGLSQMDLQDLSGVSASVIYKIEHGRADLSWSSVLAVLDALGVRLCARSPLGEELELNG